MKCIGCFSRTDVYDSRVLPDAGVRRKRKCIACGLRLVTIELLHEVLKPRVKKPKPVKIPRPKAVRPMKTSASRPTRRETNFDDIEPHSISDDLWDVARELGIEGYR